MKEAERPLLEKASQRNGKKGGSGTPLSTALNLAASSMGTGLLTLPHAFASCGPTLCTMLLAILAVTTDVTLILLIKLGRQLGVSTFGSLMQRLFGKEGSACFQLMLISVLFLALTAMQRVVLDLLPIFVFAIFGIQVSPLGLSMMVNVFVLLACYSGSYHALRFTSGAALLCLVPFIVALSQDALDSSRPSPRPAAELASMEGFLLASPILASALAGGHFSVMEMAAELKPQHRESIYPVIHVVYLLVLPACYVLVSLAGISLFGADTPKNILVEFQDNKVMEVARGVLSFTNALRMPLILMPCHSLVCDTIILFTSGRVKDNSAASSPVLNAWRTVAGMPLLLFGAACLAQWLSSLSNILGLLGGTCGVLGCFCIPGAMYLWVWRAERKNLSSNYAALAALAIVVGLAVVLSCCLSWIW
ncbi:AVT6B [Symbiodinium natans]|uniref:AVT6B protein n=1 Tax=Symbiodinium natans TaxID=878477 RepID=A0A812N5Q7_9DINO|nr:AVT6B [Symbiodinium natans]